MTPFYVIQYPSGRYLLLPPVIPLWGSKHTPVGTPFDATRFNQLDKAASMLKSMELSRSAGFRILRVSVVLEPQEELNA